MRTHYEILGVARDATFAEIRTAYRRAASQHHPDRPTGDKERMQEVQLAYDVLSDPKRREIYNQTAVADAIMLEQKAMKMLEELFMEYLCVPEVKKATEPLRHIRAHIDSELKTARGEQAHAQAMLNGMTIKLSRIVKFGSRENILERVSQDARTQLEKRQKQQIDRENVLLAVLALLDEYEHSPSQQFQNYVQGLYR